MDLCLLCLELRNGSDECIQVQSTLWQVENIEKLIEKHFWSMKTMSTTAWLCTTCWQIIKDFHQFYVRIENAHIFLTSTMKKETQDAPENYSQYTINDKSSITHTLEDSPHEFVVAISPEQILPAIDNATANEEKLLSIKTELTIEDPLTEIEKDEIDTNQNEKKCKLIKNRCKKSSSEIVRNKKSSKQSKQPNFKNKNYKESDDFMSDTDFENQTGSENDLKYKAEDEFLKQNFQINCGICQTTMNSYNDLLKHSTTEHQQPGFTSCCGKNFQRRSVLLDHIHWHLNPEYFKCKDCGKVMSDRRCLKQHARVHEKLERTHVCDECGKAFARAFALRRHKLTHLPDDEKKYSCDECGKNFGSKNLLMNHVRSVHQKKSSIVCDVCGHRTQSKEVFERHMKQHNGQPLPILSCDVCGLKMVSQRGLKRHKEIQHPEDNKRIEYKCHVCSKISPTLKAHKKHVRYQHELGFKYKCTVCEKEFKRAIALTEHMATHTGASLYTCPECPKTFNSSGNMYNHRKKSHPQEWLDACRAKYSGNLPPSFKSPKL